MTNTKTYKTKKPTVEKTLFRLCSGKVGTLKGKCLEICETRERRKLSVYCLQESRIKGSSTRSFGDGDHKFKFFRQGNSEGTNGVSIAIKGRLIEKVLEIGRVNECKVRLKIVIGHTVSNVLSVYAPQAGREDSEKRDFYSTLEYSMISLPDQK